MQDLKKIFENLVKEGLKKAKFKILGEEYIVLHSKLYQKIATLAYPSGSISGVYIKETQSKEAHLPQLLSQHTQALFEAVSEGDTERVKTLLQTGAEVNARDRNDIYGRTPLHWAATFGYSEVAKVLLNHGADVNAQDKNGWTPLYWAEVSGHSEVAAILRAAGGRKE